MQHEHHNQRLFSLFSTADPGARRGVGTVETPLHQNSGRGRFRFPRSIELRDKLPIQRKYILDLDRTAVRGRYLHLDLHEACSILARGLVRLRSRAAEERGRQTANLAETGESRLHFTAHQRGHAKPKPRRTA